MSYVKNAWYVASWSDELAAEKPLAITILGERIVVWRTAADKLHALEDRCVHRLAPLSLGRCEGERLRCMYHGIVFDPDGKVAEIPGQDLIPANARVRSYPVVDRHSWIWVWMGDPALADEGLIPPAVGLDHPDYILGHGQVDYAAEARLINNNLLDLSHLPFVHANSFASGPQYAQTQGKITPLERGIRFERWTENYYGPASRRRAEPMDTYQTYDFLIPGVLLATGGDFPVGTAKALDFGAPAYENALSGITFSSQAVTPMAARTSRYFFSFGPYRRHGDEAMRDLLMGIAGKAFDEDRTMIEAQQRVIDETPKPTVMPTAHDRGVTMFNKMVERLARQETAVDNRGASEQPRPDLEPAGDHILV